MQNSTNNSQQPETADQKKDQLQNDRQPSEGGNQSGVQNKQEGGNQMGTQNSRQDSSTQQGTQNSRQDGSSQQKNDNAATGHHDGTSGNKNPQGNH